MHVTEYFKAASIPPRRYGYKFYDAKFDLAHLDPRQAPRVKKSVPKPKKFKG